MKNTLNKFLFLFYRYYDKGSTKTIAYESSIMALMLTLFLNIFAILVYTGIEGKYLAFENDTAIPIKYLTMFAIFIPFFFLLKKIFKKEDILKIEMDKSAMRKGYFIAVAYIILSMIILALIIQSQ